MFSNIGDRDLWREIGILRKGYGFQIDVDEVGVSQVVCRVNHSVDMPINRHVEVFFRSVRKKKNWDISRA